MLFLAIFLSFSVLVAPLMASAAADSADSAAASSAAASKKRKLSPQHPPSHDDAADPELVALGLPSPLSPPRLSTADVAAATASGATAASASSSSSGAAAAGDGTALDGLDMTFPQNFPTGFEALGASSIGMDRIIQLEQQVVTLTKLLEAKTKECEDYKRTLQALQPVAVAADLSAADTAAASITQSPALPAFHNPDLSKSNADLLNAAALPLLPPLLPVLPPPPPAPSSS